MEKENLDVLLQAGTAVVCDTLDNMKSIPLVLDTSIAPVGPSLPFAGPVYTLKGEMERWSGGGDLAKLAAIDEMPSGMVALWAGTDIRGVCCFGDLLATAMKARGCVGVVVDGGVRDSAFLENLGMPIRSRYRTPAQAIGRWRVIDRLVPVKVRGALEDWVEAHPGDILVADDDGAVIVPQGIADEVAYRVSAWSEKDARAREEIAGGMHLLEALKKYGHL